jgi:hypothetical protein
MKPIWKENDWCFCEFTLRQITEVKQGIIKSVTDGNFCLGSSDLNDRCYPLDIRIKRVSDSVNYWSNKIHKLNNKGLNYPDINRKLISIWVDMCESIENENHLKEEYENLDNFGRDIINTVSKLENQNVHGVKLFR